MKYTIFGVTLVSAIIVCVLVGIAAVSLAIYTNDVLLGAIGGMATAYPFGFVLGSAKSRKEEGHSSSLPGQKS